MHIKLGHEYVVTRQRAVEVGFHCQSCGYASQAMVTATGRGKGESLLFLDEHGARERARGHADQEVRHEADKIIALAACPACGKRKAHEVATFRNGILQAVALLMPPIALVIAVLWPESPPAALLGSAAVIGIFSWYFVPTWCSRWRHIEGRIVFDDPSE